MVSADLVDPFTVTKRSNTTILVLVDSFTRWRDVIALPNGIVAVIVEAQEHWVFWYSGVGEGIDADEGTQFESDSFSNFGSGRHNFERHLLNLTNIIYTSRGIR